MRIETQRPQTDVASFMGISQAAYSRLEKGEIELTVQKLFLLSDLYGIPVHDIIRSI